MYSDLPALALPLCLPDLHEGGFLRVLLLEFRYIRIKAIISETAHDKNDKKKEYFLHVPISIIELRAKRNSGKPSLHADLQVGLIYTITWHDGKTM